MALPGKSRIIEAGAQACWVKRRTAARLGVSRPTFDLWLRQLEIDWPHGQEDVARVYRLYPHVVKHTRKHGKALVSEPLNIRLVAPTFADVSSAQTATADLRMPISIRVRESVWKRLKHEAIDRGVPAGDLAEKAFEEFLAKDKASK